MILIYGNALIEPDMIDQVKAAAREFVPKCRAEDGNVDYVLSWDMLEPTRHQLVETWESMEHYQRHREQPHTAVFRDFMETAMTPGTRYTMRTTATRSEG